MAAGWLFTWWNAVYSFPLAVVLIFLAVTSMVGLAGGALGELADGGDGGGDVGHDVGHDGGHDLAHDTDVDADFDADADMDADADLDGDGRVDLGERAVAVAHGHGHATPLVGFLVLLGAGKAPAVMLIQILLLFWGLIGLGLHQAVGAAGGSALAWSVPSTFVLSMVATRGIAAAFGKIYRPYETASLRRHQLVGRTGRVVYAVTSEAGTVNVRDQHGTLHRLRARTPQGRLESGQEIVVTGYDPESKVYQVEDGVGFLSRA